MRKRLFILIYFASPLVPILVTYFANPGYYASTGMLISLILGATAFTWISWQFVISARPKYIEVAFGMDKIYRFHGLMAIIAIIMVVIHQFIKEELFGENFMTYIGTISMFLFIGISALSLLLMVNSVVTRIQPFKLIRKIVEGLKIFKYEHYRFIHNITIVAFAFMQVHVLLTSIVKANKTVFAAYMTYFLLGLGFYAYHKVIKPFILQEERYVITDVIEETPAMWSLYMKPKKGEIMAYKPGQFGFFRVTRGVVASEEHPFSISSSPTNKNKLSVTIKALGDYTTAINQVKIGDEVTIDGPYGRFSYTNFEKEKTTVFIAGGVGITPVLSMLRYMKDMDSERRVVLIWGMNQINEYIIADEMKTIITSMPNLEVVPVVANDPDFNGEKGYIDRNKIERILSEARMLNLNTGFYLCGPPILMDNSIKNLSDLGVSKTMIHYEKFSL